MPPTTGGSTIGRVVRPRSSALPRNCPRASSHANGNPNSSARLTRKYGEVLPMESGVGRS